MAEVESDFDNSMLPSMNKLVALFTRGHPKVSHFPKWAVVVGKWVVLKPKMGSLGHGLLGEKVARNVFSWHPSQKHLVYDLFERHSQKLAPYRENS